MRASALRFGAFTLKDGSTSPLFINLGAVATGEHLTEIGELFAIGILQQFPEVDTVFGPAYKGFTIATATALALAKRQRNVSVFFDRKEAKAHGEGGLFFGALPHAQSRIVVLDDVTTSGLTKETAFKQIAETFSVRPIGVLVAVDRRRASASTEAPGAVGASLNLRSLVTLGDISAHLDAIGHPERDTVMRFLGHKP
jgi:orotate phosphoribosyltransferase